MKLKKFYVNDLFRKTEFVELLNKKGIYAYELENAIVFDLNALDKLSIAEMPHWIYMNRKAMRSEFHTEDVES